MYNEKEHPLLGFKESQQKQKTEFAEEKPGSAETNKPKRSGLRDPQ